MQSFIQVNKITIIRQSCRQREAQSLHRLEQLKLARSGNKTKVRTTLDIMTLAKEEEKDLKRLKRMTN
jgi:hypothetical protein